MVRAVRKNTRRARCQEFGYQCWKGRPDFRHHCVRCGGWFCPQCVLGGHACRLPEPESEPYSDISQSGQGEGFSCDYLASRFDWQRLIILPMGQGRPMDGRRTFFSYTLNFVYICFFCAYSRIIARTSCCHSKWSSSSWSWPWHRMVLNGFHKSTLLDDFGIENKYEVEFSIRLLGESQTCQENLQLPKIKEDLQLPTITNSATSS